MPTTPEKKKHNLTVLYHNGVVRRFACDAYHLTENYLLVYKAVRHRTIEGKVLTDHVPLGAVKSIKDTYVPEES